MLVSQGMIPYGGVRYRESSIAESLVVPGKGFLRFNNAIVIRDSLTILRTHSLIL